MPENTEDLNSLPGERDSLDFRLKIYMGPYGRFLSKCTIFS